ncbi:unnamed protein product [Symbiodinium microadriaticum]|nr:unnamed protein product [Symbiodinium microadriaticum]
MEGKEVVAFIGSPGGGKSTLLSSLSGQHFDSGVGFVVGLTKELQVRTAPHLPMFEFVDTPGLADGRAAQAINQLLNQVAQQDYRVKVFFVMTLEAGRMKAEDLYTIKQVQIHTGQIVPRVAKVVQLQLGVASKAVPFTTTFIEYVPFSPDADGAENATVPCADLLQRLAAFPGIFVQSALPIDVRDWEQRLEDLKEQLERETEHKIKAAVLHIDVARASDLHYTPGQQVRVKQVDIKQGQILVDLGSGLAWVNARDVSITQEELEYNEKIRDYVKPIDVRDWEQRLEDLKEQLERETEHKIKAAVLHIDVARASDLHYTPGQQVRVK